MDHPETLKTRAAVLSGLAPMGTPAPPGAILTRLENTVTGSYYGSGHPPSDFRRYAELYLEGKLDLDRLISKTYSLEEINGAFADLVTGKLSRGIVVF